MTTDHTPVPVMKPWLGEEEVAAAAEAIRSGWVAQGPRVRAFEEAFAAHVGAAHGVAVSSCTTGLHLGLHLLGIGAGDEVVVPSLSFIATANAARYVGADPVFADVDGLTGNLTPETVEPLLTDRTKAVVVVHQGGMPADVDALRKLLDPRGIVLFEDAGVKGLHGGPDRLAVDRRSRLVEYALAARLVTADDLPLLDSAARAAAAEQAERQ